MFYPLYNIASIFLLIPVIVYHLYRSLSRKRPPAFAERFGLHCPGLPAEIAKRPVIWLHAVSVGEAMAARPLLKEIRIRYPHHAIVMSTTTETGRSLATTFPEPDLCIYFPFDFYFGVRRVMAALCPVLIIIMETEIWPNFSREAARRRVPLVLANGRISDRSYRGYQRFSWFFRHALHYFSALCMQTETDRERIVSIGAPAEQTLTVGNLKYDLPYRAVALDEKDNLRQRYGIPAGAVVITAGSTHAGEEEILITCYRTLCADLSELFLVLVPRHPERAPDVVSLLEAHGIAYRCRTAQAITSPRAFMPGEVLLVDTIGELQNLYALADIAFVGGSLVPTGGHNLLEPASVGVPSLFGPHMTNFREIAELVLRCNAGMQVASDEELVSVCQKLILDPLLRQRAGNNGLELMAQNGGATNRHCQIIGRYL